MAQYLKEEVRNDIARAALEIFARDGYEGARIPDIAARAGVSTGNIYRYYRSKDELYYSVVDARFAAAFLRALRRRVRALGGSLEGEPPASARQVANELLAFWIEHRLKVVVILSRARGSRYEGFPRRVVHELKRLTLAHAARGGAPSAPDRCRDFVLEQIFENTVSMIVAILLASADEAVIRSMFQAFWRYQIAGLRSLVSP